MDFANDDTAFGIDHESTALSKAGAFDHDAEVTSHLTCRIAEHREFDFLDGFGGIVPGFVREVCVGGNGINFAADLFELSIVISEVFKLRRADEREVGRLEENHGPFAFQVCVCDFFEFEALEGLNAEGLKLGAY